jgi:hypothetical protein
MSVLRNFARDLNVTALRIKNRTENLSNSDHFIMSPRSAGTVYLLRFLIQGALHLLLCHPKMLCRSFEAESLLEDHSQTRLLLNNGLTRQLCTALTLLKLLKMDGSLGWKMWLYTYWHSICNNDLLRQNKFCHGLMRSFIIIIIIGDDKW